MASFFSIPLYIDRKKFTGIHVFDVGLHLVLVSGGDINGCANFFLTTKLAGVDGNVGNEIPFYTEIRECLFLFKGGDDAPFATEVFGDILDCLISVANVVVIQLLDVG